MKMTVKLTKILSVLLMFVLITAIALSLSSCKKTDTESPAGGNVSAQTVGEGQTSFNFQITFADSSQKAYIVNTDKTNVGDALVEAGLIEGDDSQYGLFVTKVDGVEALYEKDGSYWAFYVNGEYATASVSDTQVTAGATYEFKVEK